MTAMKRLRVHDNRDSVHGALQAVILIFGGLQYLWGPRERKLPSSLPS